jgi:hypothetical protein
MRESACAWGEFTWGSGTAPLLLKLDRGVSDQLYPWEKCPQYPLNWRLSGPQNQSGCLGEEINTLPLLGLKVQFFSYPSSSLVTIPTAVHTIKKLLSFQILYIFNKIQKDECCYKYSDLK